MSDQDIIADMENQLWHCEVEINKLTRQRDDLFRQLGKYCDIPKIEYLSDKCDKLEAQNKIMREALEVAIEEFSQDTSRYQTGLALRYAKQALDKGKELNNE